MNVRLSTFLVLTVVLVFALLLPRPGNDSASAHPLGEFTINHYSEVKFSADSVRIDYVIDFAELTTLEQILDMEGASEQDIEDADLDEYLRQKVPDLVNGLDLEIGGQPVSLDAIDTHAEFHPGNWGFNLLRVELTLEGALPVTIGDEPVSGRYVVRNFPGRLGWHEIVMPHGGQVTVLETNALHEGVSNRLHDYPSIDEQEPLEIYDVEFTLVRGDEAEPEDDDAAGSAAARIQEGERSSFERLTGAAERLVDLEGAGLIAITLTMIGAFVWGALHALTPGHGKAVVGAYLIGSRGTAKHAVFLGMTVTATHTAGIFALGFVTLALSHLILPESLFPWLSMMSGVLVILIGAGIGYRRWRAYRETGVADDHGHHHHHHDHDHHHHDHDHGHHHGHEHAHDHHLHHGHDHGHHHHHHGHSHLPPGTDGSDVTWRSLLALGVSGGMVPCPSALVLLLGAISLGRLEFGLILVVLFSIGLAAVLTGIGLMMVYMRSIFNRFAFEARAPGVLPILSSIAITVAGVIIVMGAASQAGIL
jgi:nickel/cobalt transporter (NicO) family protein